MVMNHAPNTCALPDRTDMHIITPPVIPWPVESLSCRGTLTYKNFRSKSIFRVVYSTPQGCSVASVAEV
jgi:hypothetical protein